MDKSTEYFRLMCTALRNENHLIPDSDAEVAQLIKDALEVISPDDTEQQEMAGHLAITFEMLEGDIRNEERDDGQ